MYRVCFVCTGNICRSPWPNPSSAPASPRPVSTPWSRWTAPAPAAGTGDGADPRTVTVLEAAGYEQSHRARQFRASWFAGLDLVIALDAGHLRELRSLAPTPEDAAKVRLLRSYDPAATAAEADVPDPYYGSLDGFEQCLELVEAASAGLLDAVREAVKEHTA